MRFSAVLALVAAAWTFSPVLATYEGKCQKPDVRNEWRELTDGQKKAFIKAVKCLGKLPHESSLAITGATPGLPPVNTSSSRFDDFVYAHMDSNIKDHFTGIFFPWHRWYLHTFEKALRTRCGYKGTIPFWDWSKDTDDIPGSAIFNSSKTYGFGTFGTNATNYEVVDGAFGNTIRAYPTPHRVVRKFDLYPFRKKVFPFEFSKPDMPATDAFTARAVKAVVDGAKGNFTDFAYRMDGVRAQGMHNAAHLMMGGDLSNPLVSPNDPLFYLHHAHLDCIWARWQARRKENRKAFGGGLTQDLEHYDTYPVGAPPKAERSADLPTVGLSGPVKVDDVMSTKGGYLCYECAY
ncbi:hypothetical protein FS749_014464 [Ceratobasidium sp. UAMH 11750]|nr:hypothetical protein FS749_014464 [Ceratobasidium sp. UAMH 11750]